jgi:hypothetical protein
MICLPIILVLALAGLANSALTTRGADSSDNNNIVKSVIKAANPEYKYVTDAAKIFPANFDKQKVLTDVQPAKYTLENLDYKKNGIELQASHLVLSIHPTKIIKADEEDNNNKNNKDNNITRLNVDIYGTNVTFTAAGQFSKNYSTLKLTDSIYAIYDVKTNEVAVHIPLATSISHLLI